MASVEAKWSGGYPKLCRGEWSLFVDGEDKSHLIPDSLRGNSMLTHGTYMSWRFGSGWDEVWEEYEDGKYEDEWIAENIDWLSQMSGDPEIHSQIFRAIQEEDFRPNSCGGCI
jgi:hypothetical protein